jgi:hypothetical protein
LRNAGLALEGELPNGTQPFNVRGKGGYSRRCRFLAAAVSLEFAFLMSGNLLVTGNVTTTSWCSEVMVEIEVQNQSGNVVTFGVGFGAPICTTNDSPVPFWRINYLPRRLVPLARSDSAR